MNAGRIWPEWRARGRRLIVGQPQIMGILNVTPDSFSDGGWHLDPHRAAEQSLRLVAEGAGLIDLGGESTRPGAEPVDLKTEQARILPVLEALQHALDCPISIDTTKPEVARLALEKGAAVVNDIQALADPAMARIAAEADAGVVLMHMAGTPRTMQVDPHYTNVLEDVYTFLARAIDRALAAGIPLDHIAIDPGIGFGKTTAHNQTLLRNLGRFAALGCAILVGTSRKRTLGEWTGRPVNERAVASAVSAVAAIESGAAIVRVHDVGYTRDAIRVWEAQRGWSRLP
jgi:dihydropteroate synthase